MNETQSFFKGQRVNTPQGEGKVNYQRMAPPSYSEAEAVSVYLDSRVEAMTKPPFPSYSGTIFPAEQIQSLE